MMKVNYRDEMKRYDDVYQSSSLRNLAQGSMFEQAEFQEPYLHYENLVNSFLRDDMKILELASGDGAYSNLALQENSISFITDISHVSLKRICSSEEFSKNKVSFIQCDMQQLPFRDNFFDLIVMSQSLSYGDTEVVSDEVKRVLSKGGKFVLIDSIYDNFFYTLNRWIKYKRGLITKSSFKNRLKYKKLLDMSQKFNRYSISTYNSLVFLYPILKIFFSNKKIVSLSSYFDKKFSIFDKYRFKAVCFFEK